MTWTLEERRRRREKLQAWLAPPDANGKGAGPLFRKSYQEIAAALSQEFNRKISKWSARDYVRTLWQLEERKARLHVGGRPSMPGRVTENLDEALTEKIDQSEPDQFDMLVGAFRDLMQLCDISTAELHRLLKNCPELKEMVGSKSSMHKMLALDGEQNGVTYFRYPGCVIPTPWR